MIKRDVVTFDQDDETMNFLFDMTDLISAPGSDTTLCQNTLTISWVDGNKRKTVELSILNFYETEEK